MRSAGMADWITARRGNTERTLTAAAGPSPCDPYRQALTIRPSLKAPAFSFLNYYCPTLTTPWSSDHQWRHCGAIYFCVLHAHCRVVLTHSPTHSLTHPHSLTHHPPTHPTTHPTADPPTHSHSLTPTHSLTHSLTHPLTHPLTHSLTHPLRGPPPRRPGKYEFRRVLEWGRRRIINGISTTAA